MQNDDKKGLLEGYKGKNNEINGDNDNKKLLVTISNDDDDDVQHHKIFISELITAICDS